MSGPNQPGGPNDPWGNPNAGQQGSSSQGQEEGGPSDATRVFNTSPQQATPNQGPAQGWGQQPPQQQGQPQQWGAGPTQQWGAQTAPTQQGSQWGANPPGQQPQQGQQWAQTQVGPTPQSQGWGQQPQQPPQQQWGQQPQQQADNQWGAPQANQWGAPGQQTPAAPAGKKNKNLLIGGIVGAVVLIAALGAVWFFFLRTTTLDPAAAQDGVTKILTENYGAKDTDISDVSCPADQKVEKDSSFDCSLKVKDVEKTVTITFTNDDGEYTVSRPQDKE